MYEGFTHLPLLFWNLFQIIMVVIMILLASFIIKSWHKAEAKSKELKKNRSPYDMIMSACLVIPILMGLWDFIHQKPIPDMAETYFRVVLPFFITIMVLVSIMEIAVPYIDKALKGKEDGDDDE